MDDALEDFIITRITFPRVNCEVTGFDIRSRDLLEHLDR